VYYDALTIAAIRDELEARLVGGRVQRVVQIAELVIGLEIYAGQRHQLLLSAEARSPRVLLAEDKLRRGVEKPSPLHLLLAKYVDGARLTAIEQPPLERVLRLRFEGAYGPVDLVAELMGRYSNIILLAPDGVIMEAIKRVPASINRYRTILPQHPYAPPPPQAKENPRLLTALHLRELLAAQPEGPWWRRLVDAISGISPLLAREIVYRATEEDESSEPPDVAQCAALLAALDALMRLPETHAWSPCIAFEEDQPRAYAPYDLTHWLVREPASSISEAITRVENAKQTFDAYKQVRDRLRDLIEEQRTRQNTRLASLRRSLTPQAEIDALQWRANAILALAWKIAPRQRELVVNPAELGLNTGEANQPVHIPLDPTLSPAENAQKLFREYHKMKTAADEVPPLIEQGERELEYLAQLSAEVELAENRSELDQVEREMIEAGYIAARDKKPKSTVPNALLSRRAQDGTLILVGRNSQQNDEVTFRRGAPDDLWLHAHGAPGAHVIIKCAGQPVDEDTLLLAARLAAYYSEARREPCVQVDYTARRYVRHIKDAHPGMVTYTHEQTLVVEPDLDEISDSANEW